MNPLYEQLLHAVKTVGVNAINRFNNDLIPEVIPALDKIHSSSDLRDYYESLDLPIYVKDQAELPIVDLRELEEQEIIDGVKSCTN
jgi:hypothetical protein